MSKTRKNRRGPRKQKGGEPSFDLITAFNDNNVPRVKKALKAGADANTNNLIDAAARNAMLPIFKLLLKHGAKPSSETLMDAIYNQAMIYDDFKVERRAMVKTLISKYKDDIDLNYEDDENTPLLLAVMNDDRTMVKILLDAGATNFDKPTGNSAIELAADADEPERMLALFESDAKVEDVPMMNEDDFKKCDDHNEKKNTIQCGIQLTNVSRKNALKLPNTNVCYSRKNLTRWFKNNPGNPTNPHSREKVDKTWMDKYFPNGINAKYNIIDPEFKVRRSTRRRRTVKSIGPSVED